MSTALMQEQSVAPAPTAEIMGGVTGLEQWAKALIITSNEEYAAAAETAKGVKRWRSTIVEFFADSKAKAHAAWKSVVASEKSMTDRLDNVEALAKRAMIMYQQEQEKQRQAEQARLQAEADEAARKERERLEKEAAKLKTPELKAERLEQAAAVEAPQVYVAPRFEKVAGTSTRKIWKAEVLDAEKVPRSFLCVNEKALDAYAKSTKGECPIDGVRFYCEDSLAIGGR